MCIRDRVSAIAAVSSSAVLTSFAVSFPPINDVKAVSGWGSDTFPSDVYKRQVQPGRAGLFGCVKDGTIRKLTVAGSVSCLSLIHIYAENC